MPEYEITIKIECTATAENKEQLEQDLKRKAAQKDELQRIVEVWLNEGTAQMEKSTAEYFNEEMDRYMELQSKQTMERLKRENRTKGSD